MTKLDQLKQLIREETDALICQTHPEICQMRDMNYSSLEDKLIDISIAYEISIQSAIAHLEQELGHL